jgi:tetratricopeptide (TPR) repeat protein
VRRSPILRLALALACAAEPAVARPQEPEVVPLGRDPDRGLDAALRERLALVDATRDVWPVERWAVLVEARLGVLARLWNEDRLAELAAEPWILPELSVAPLGAGAETPAEAHAAWSSVRREVPGTGEARAFATALAAWRAEFTGAARLEHELLAIDGDEPELVARLRLTASGTRDGAREQHDADWSATWRVTPAGEAAERGAVLTSVRVESFEAVRLAPGAQGFADVTESVFGAETFAREVAPGLDAWRRRLPDVLEPGSLGHHGLALGDVDGDGREDLYWCRPGGLPNKLFLHAPDDTVVDVSAAAGVDLLDYSASALLLELDGDGDLDLVVSTGTGLAFFANDGRARFEQRLFLERSLVISLAAADFDADGDLDVYACSYVSPFEKSGTPVPYHDANNGEANQLLANDGEWGFTDVTAAVGLDENNRRFTLGASWEDFDQDGDPDLYVANDFGRNNLYRNEGGRFRDVAAEFGALDVSAGMGVSWGDFDGDGWADLYVTNMHSLAGARLTARPGFRAHSSAETLRMFRDHALGNTLLRNEAGRAFRDVSEASGTDHGRWGWGGIFVELDNDGALDLFAGNGLMSGARHADLDSFFWRQVVLQSPEGPGEPGASYSLGWRAVNRLARQGWSWNGHERNVAFLNRGGARFADASGVLGLDHTDDSRAAARVDWDGDGDEDLLVTNRTGPMLRVLRNELAPGAGWIAFALEARARPAIGTQVTLETSGGRRLVRSLRCGEGFLAQSSARLHFGLGNETVARVAVRWPDGEREDFGAPAAGTAWALAQGAGAARALPARSTPSALRASQPEPARASEFARTVLPVPLALPRLALEASDGRAASLFGIGMQGPRGTGQPLLLVLVSFSVSGAVSGAAGPCRRELARLAEDADALAGVQILALSVDPPEQRAGLRAELEALAWPFGWGASSEEALAILELVQGVLHDDVSGLVLPTAFLVDPRGRLAVTYQGRIEPERVRADLALFERSPAELRDAAVPFPGRWCAPLPQAFDESVAARLDLHGLTRPAGEYRLARVEVRSPASAQLHYESGVTHHQAERFAEAVASYRRALASDPGHLKAAQNLGVALHQLGDRPGALSAYRQALQLEPGHARTRSNLGLLLVELGDLPGAKRELEALRSLKSELAPKLAERIRAQEGK